MPSAPDSDPDTNACPHVPAGTDAHADTDAATDAAPAAEPDLVESWQLLVGLVLEQRWRWAEVAAELDLTQAGLRALLAINPDHPRPMRDLANAMNCDPSYLTGMVDDLERAGYAIRQLAPDDRRVKTVVLTPAGHAALRTARDGLFAPPPQLARLPPAQQRQLAHLLRTGLDPNRTMTRS